MWTFQGCAQFKFDNMMFPVHISMGKGAFSHAWHHMYTDKKYFDMRTWKKYFDVRM